MGKTRGKYNQYTDYENYTMLSEKELEVLQLYNLGMQLEKYLKAVIFLNDRFCFLKYFKNYF